MQLGGWWSAVTAFRSVADNAAKVGRALVVWGMRGCGCYRTGPLAQCITSTVSEEPWAHPRCAAPLPALLPAQVVCRQLGKAGGVLYRNARYGFDAALGVLVGELDCPPATAFGLNDCRYVVNPNGYFPIADLHSDDVGVACVEPSEPPPSTAAPCQPRQPWQLRCYGPAWVLWQPSPCFARAVRTYAQCKYHACLPRNLLQASSPSVPSSQTMSTALVVAS